MILIVDVGAKLHGGGPTFDSFPPIPASPWAGFLVAGGGDQGAILEAYDWSLALHKERPTAPIGIVFTAEVPHPLETSLVH